MLSTTLRRSAAVALASLALLGAGCSSDSDSTSTTAKPSGDTTETTESAAEVRATILFNKEIQTELAEVGCHPGAADGEMGPHTDAAIVAFQTAAGIKVDGELGPQTEAALKKAVADGTKVCSENTGSTTTAPKSTTTVPSGGVAPCTAAGMLEGLPDEGEKIGSFLCVGDYAAGSLTDGTKFLLQSEGGKWYAPSQDPCGSASAGIDPKILEAGCPA